MVATLPTLVPFFALIGVGWLFGRLQWLPQQGVQILNLYVVRLGLPVLMFEFIARSDWALLWNPAFALAYALGTLCIFALGLLLIGHRRPLAERSISALAASYSNTAYLALPICALVFGDQGMAAAVVATLLTVACLFALAILLVEIGRQKDNGLLIAIKGIVRALLQNPLISAPILAGVWLLLDLPYPEILYRSTHLISLTAAPVALFNIGLFLAFNAASHVVSQPAPQNLPNQPQPSAGRHLVWPAVTLKLLIHPLVMWAIVWLLQVPQPWGLLAVLIAATPTGTGPFMVAQLYGQDASAAARVILISTLISAISLAVLLGYPPPLP